MRKVSQYGVDGSFKSTKTSKVIPYKANSTPVKATSSYYVEFRVAQQAYYQTKKDQLNTKVSENIVFSFL